jgi:hypothetical protein
MPERLKARGDVLAHAEASHDPGGERRRRGEHGDVDDEHVHVAWPKAGLVEELGDGRVEEGVHLVERVLVGGRVLAALEDVARAVALLADAGADHDPEEEAVLGEAQALVTLDNMAGHLRAHLAAVTWIVADIVQEVALRLPATGDNGAHQGSHRARKVEHSEQKEKIHRTLTL